MMLSRVAETVRRHRMFEPGQSVGVAVSAGADSVCLLHVLREFDLRLTVLHLNHGLRGEESCADEQFVRELAARLGASGDYASGGCRGAWRQSGTGGATRASGILPRAIAVGRDGSSRYRPHPERSGGDGAVPFPARLRRRRTGGYPAR